MIGVYVVRSLRRKGHFIRISLWICDAFDNKAEIPALDPNEFLSKSQRARNDITPKIGFL
jgi:hypothetical protein